MVANTDRVYPRYMTLLRNCCWHRLSVVQPGGPNVFSVKTPKGRFNVVTFASPEDVAARGIPGDAIIGVLPPGVVEIEPSTIKLNASFVLLLHRVIAEHGPSAPGLMNQALEIGSGSLVVTDARAGTQSDQPESEDVFGAFQVKDGQIAANSYQPNPDYLLVSKKGLFVLDAWLHSKLLEELAKLQKTVRLQLPINARSRYWLP